MPRFADTTVGTHNKIFIPPAGVHEIHFPRLDQETRQWIYAPEDVRPVVRTYTHRGFNAVKNEMYIDFVAHGENGPASAWALQCKPGDILGVAMHDAVTELYPQADWYLLAGDATAIPVVSAILASLPSHVNGKCIIEVSGKEDEQVLETKASIEFHWVHNPAPETLGTLAQVVKAIECPATSRFAYVGAECSTLSEIRTWLRKEMNWKREELSAYSYWKSDVSEDKSASERRREDAEV